jgi:hypothetical protein
VPAWSTTSGQFAGVSGSQFAAVDVAAGVAVSDVAADAAAPDVVIPTMARLAMIHPICRLRTCPPPALPLSGRAHGAKCSWQFDDVLVNF